MSYVSAADAAKIIRTKLKAMGFGTKHVSVTSDSYSMGSSIRVRVKDTSIALSKVEAVANEQEDVRRCEYSGEILSGGNRYVTVEYDRAALEAASAPILAQLPTETKDGHAVVEGFQVHRNGEDFSVWVEGEFANGKRSWGTHHTAGVIVGMIAERAAVANA